MAEIRHGRQGDIAAIQRFTTGTFEWGDYVPDMIAGWIHDPAGGVLVAVDATDTPIAMGRCTLLTPDEAWIHAARVHPDHRGRGLAGEMATALTDWARDHGAIVARLMIEDHNESSIRHITKTPFRRTTTIHRCHRTLGAGSPTPSTNGGTRRKSNLVARPVKSSDAEMVTALWSSSEPGRALRGLLARDWSFHRLRTEDTFKAAMESRLWDIGGAWAITNEHDDGEFNVELIAATAADAPDVARSLVDLATSHGATDFRAWIADLPWLVSAFEHTGCVIEPCGIWTMAL